MKISRSVTHFPAVLGYAHATFHHQNDFRLVISNAKSFNPPGSIYHTEAERIEAWGLDRITKAAATVIEYETDWNIEIDGDDRLNIPEEEDTPEPETTDSRAQSILSNSQPHQPLLGRRSARAAATAIATPPVAPVQKAPKSISETLQPDGGLPGSKDGLGKFPPGSDLARVMLALKLKGSYPFISHLYDHVLTDTSRQEIQDKEGTPPYREERPSSFS